MAEFWEEEVKDDRREMRKQVLRWSLLFVLLFSGVFFAIWWASAAVNFSASRVEATTGPTYRITGIVRDAATGSAIPWAEITDAPSGRPPLFHATADRFGAYELVTIAEPHNLFITALGYRPGSVRVGKAWYMWMPKGAEKVDIKLQKEP
jgi:hypothetical protein